MLQIVYVIHVYKNPKQLIRLVKRLNAPQVNFLIHVDKKTDDDYIVAVQRGLKDLNNIDFIKRETVFWGGWGLTQSMINAIHHIENKQLPCDFAVIISGQDYPIKSHDSIIHYLEKNQGKQFLEHYPLPYEGWTGRGGLQRIDRYHLRVMGRHLVYPPFGNHQTLNHFAQLLLRVLPFTRRKLPHDYKPYGGSAYIVLAENAVNYLHQFLQTQAGQELMQFYRFANIVDEMFFHTLLLNSPLKNTVVDHALIYNDWTNGGPHPKVFTCEDYVTLQSQPHLFARKFDIHHDAQILDMLDERHATLQ